LVPSYTDIVVADLSIVVCKFSTSGTSFPNNWILPVLTNDFLTEPNY